eukprot:TRINITY_DN6352_c0_g1::TRINITY_DN6352_c0_g1_i1::g.524::m.524 TRINITY_DN6352_c0_g1::TRINITY_DN6352_c0_g1_i1::g.524  ORF type:complete len:151 (-),score=19.18,sp/Q9SQT4/NDA8A_ARATH/39.81/4e-14,CHCH/PF06747.8/3,CHCH/PF06747.8/5.6,Colipase-like/PF15083.1/0.24 TRINITY_DN6352_c0_g1_i1:210-662(-)
MAEEKSKYVQYDASFHEGKKLDSNNMDKYSANPIEYNGHLVSTGIKYSAMLAAHKFLAITCLRENEAFLRCKRNNTDPEDCLKQGEQVIKCSILSMKLLNQYCSKEHCKMVDCLDDNHSKFGFCESERTAAETCGLKHAEAIREKIQPEL